ncbi:extracellular solute-binding protein [Vallitalea pronyensis]|uniref:Extracellular solute-binding protein n=1 Tax=Vallitalea pronyensis TaxID=1348613 RepID=A0A8J8MIA9_9FIRM|nr:extracellular solute-binding protein [Vallitalea pronyensis]QUI22114.1 extracellular solute-binding protein [Vallitalea pronyensis]
MRKRLTDLTSVLLVMVLILAGCGGHTEESSSQKKETGDKGSICTPKGVFPIVKEGEEVTLTVTVHNKNTDDYENNVFTKYLEEQTGVRLKFNVLNHVDSEEQFNIMMTSGDYTDIILGLDIPRAEQTMYAQDGMLIPLNDLYATYGDGIKAAIKEYGSEEEIIAYLSLNDGNMYGITNFVESFHTKAKNKMWIYKPWLDTLGLEVPQTTEEFYHVLKAFKEQDPNGNGIADEVPLAGAAKGWETQVDKFLMNAFAFNNTSGRDNLYLDGNTVYASFNTEGWRQGIEYMHQLYNEGLIAPESCTQDSKQLKLMGESEVPILGAAAAGAVSEFTQVNGDSGRWLEYVPVPILEGPTGRRKNIYNETAFDQYRAYITDRCKHPDVAFRVIDFLLREDVNRMAQYGIEGTDWRHAEDGEQGLDGKQGVIKIMQTPERNTTWAQSIPELQPLSFRIGRVFDLPHIESILYRATKEHYLPYAADDGEMLPRDLIYPEDVATELVDLQTNIKTYVDEMLVRFVFNDADIKKDWDNYLQELENIGLKRYIEIVQDAYNQRYGK